MSMDNFWVYPNDIFPKFNYKPPIIPEKRCGNCIHGLISREGAYIPGWQCSLMDKLYRKKYPKRRTHEPPCIYNEVDIRFGVCDNWKVNPLTSRSKLKGDK